MKLNLSLGVLGAALLTLQTVSAQSLQLNGPRSFRVSNRYNASRMDQYVSGTIPLNPGELPSATVDQPCDIVAVSPNDPTQRKVFVRPFGRKYPDGSFRFAEAIFKANVPAGTTASPGEATYTLTSTDSPYTHETFRLGPNTAAMEQLWGPGYGAFAVVLWATTSTTSGVNVPVILDLNGVVGSPAGPNEIILEGPRRTLRFVRRVGDLVFTYLAYQLRDSDSVQWELRVTNSGYHDGEPGTFGPTGTQNYTELLHDVSITTQMPWNIGMYGERGHEPVGVGGFPGAAYTAQNRLGHRAATNGGSGGLQSTFISVPSLLLHGYELMKSPSQGEEGFGHMQSQVWRGVITAPSWDTNFAATYSPEQRGNHEHFMVAMCQEWQSTSAFGPQGYLAPGTTSAATVSTKFQDYWNWLTRDGSYASMPTDLWERYVQGPNGKKIGLQRDNGATGSQADFGIVEGWDAFSSGDPRLAEEYGYLGYNSSRRCAHAYHGPDANSGGEIVHFTETSHPHPQQIPLYFKTTYYVGSQTFMTKRKTASKPFGQVPGGSSSPRAETHEKHDWSGWTQSHMSINHLYTAYLLNPWSRTLEEQLDFVLDYWMLRNPSPNNGLPTLLNKYKQARIVGRSYFSVAQIASARGIHFAASTDNPIFRLNERTDDCILRDSTAPAAVWPLRQSMTGPNPVIAPSDSHTVPFYDLDASGTQCVVQNDLYVSPWMEGMAGYGLFAASLLNEEDGNPNISHANAAKSVTETSLSHGIYWAQTDPPTGILLRPNGQVLRPNDYLTQLLPQPFTCFVSNIVNTPGSTPLPWMRSVYNLRWRPNAQGQLVVPTDPEVLAQQGAVLADSNLSLWMSPSVLILEAGLLGPSVPPEATAFKTRMLANPEFVRWRWRD